MSCVRSSVAACEAHMRTRNTRAEHVFRQSCADCIAFEFLSVDARRPIRRTTVDDSIVCECVCYGVLTIVCKVTYIVFTRVYCIKPIHCNFGMPVTRSDELPTPRATSREV